MRLVMQLWGPKLHDRLHKCEWGIKREGEGENRLSYSFVDTQKMVPLESKGNYFAVQRCSGWDIKQSMEVIAIKSSFVRIVEGGK